MKIVDKDILNTLWTLVKTHKVSKFNIQRDVIINGVHLPKKMNIHFWAQNPNGSSPEAQAVKKGELKADDIYWLFTKNPFCNRRLWLGKVIKGEPTIYNDFRSEDNVWKIFTHETFKNKGK